jgi:xylulokinase
MKRHPHILAIDHGTSGVKASLLSAHGRVAASDFEKTPIHFLPGGGAEQDPQDWWNALLATARRLVTGGAVPAESIEAVCVSSTFSSTVAVDAQGRHLANSLTWMDSRGAPHIARAMRGFPNVMGYGLFKVLEWVRKTAGAPSLSGKDDAAHVLLWKHEFPHVYEKTHMFLPSKDYLNLRLTGEFAASFDSMQLFWVTDTRDIHRMHYDDRLIRILGLDREKLPPLRASTDILGPLLPEVADRLGVRSDVKVVMGSPDHQCALIGSGAVRDFEGHVYIGTSSWVQCIVPFKKADAFHAIASFPTAIPGKYQSVNEQDLAGGCLGFLAENILFHKNELVTGEPPENCHERMDRVAERVEPGSHGLIFTPWLNGERTPVDSTTLRGGLYNLSKTTTLDHIVRAFLEGVAYNTRWSLRYVEKFVGRRLDPLSIVGGGARSDVWCRIFADVLDREIRQVKDPLQANARGAAFIASVGLGHIAFEDIPGLIEYEKTFSPNPANRGIYDERFRCFLEIYENNRRMFARLNSGPSA